ncbi:MAG: type IX secretion system membrane protein PorP/SprF [Flavobacteriaceae bacterium]|nr:type IX secretion system membrane protein PorP/SprF [Bacteroidia bacterium]NNF73895.1 type IX secretion system membrane protein PorP/SprF [Flavobacteriaceae bacterium]NNK87495.1 type IX secretion system membrane protein PorP/SprF [Flavobacteriaceae bacterium]
MKKTALNIVFMICVTCMFAQQQPQFTQYMYNTISINPAYAGSREILVINMLNRNQWVGLNGAPVTQTLSVHSSIPGTKLGVGLSVINDRLAYEQALDVAADVSYTINLSEDYMLAFGVKLGASKFDLDDDLLNDPLYNDDPFLDNVYYQWKPNIGAGIYFRTQFFYVGFSAPKFLTFVDSNNTGYYDLDKVSYYLNGGYLLEVNQHIKFKPTFLVKYTNGAPMTVDISSSVLLNEKLWLTGFYRFNDSFGAIVNFKLTDAFSVGYSYDYITSDLNPYTSGSHELILSYEFNIPRPRCKCPDLYN